MALQSTHCTNDEDILGQIKLISGRCIEERRKLVRLTQEQLATDAGIGVRWLREIEGGNPKPAIEDHLRCAARLGMPTGYFFLPMMFMEHRRIFPRDLLLGDINQLQAQCIEFIIQDYYLGTITRKTRPCASSHGTAD